jgi:hypothetical protein
MSQPMLEWQDTVSLLQVQNNRWYSYTWSYPHQMLAWQDAEVITVQVDPFGSDTWRLDQIVDLIKNGGVGVIPTDTVYVIAIPFMCLHSVSFPTVDMVRHGKWDGLDVRLLSTISTLSTFLSPNGWHVLVHGVSFTTREVVFIKKLMMGMHIYWMELSRLRLSLFKTIEHMVVRVHIITCLLFATDMLLFVIWSIVRPSTVYTGVRWP